MKKIISFAIPVLILIGLVGGIAYKLKTNKTIAEERVYHYDPPAEAAPADEAPKPAQQASTDKLLFTGTFEPFRETKISAEVQGKINQITVNEGSRVTKGQSLVLLDDALLQWQLQSVAVQIEGLTADVNRYTILAEADAVQGVQLEKALLGLKSAQVQQASIQEQINKTTIRAPFSGIVHAKMSEVGAFAAPGVPLLHLLDVGQLKFTIYVPENDLQFFELGQTHEIATDAFPDKKITGKIAMIGSKANPGSRFAVQFTVDNFSSQTLRAGMFGSVEIPLQN